MQLIFALVAFLTIFTCAHALTETQIAEIDELLENEFREPNHIPGIGLAIVHGNDTLGKGYGFRNLEEQLLATNDTRFGIGSISKSFTALIAIRVLSSTFPELGESVLDVPIRALIPSLNFTLIDRFRSENVNFRDLLSHRVCTNFERIGLYANPFVNKAEYIYRQRYAEPLCSVRTDFVYNNGLLQMAGEIAAFIADTTYEQLLVNLLADLGMSQTTFIQESDDPEGIPMLAKPYYRQDGVTRRMNATFLKPVANAPGSGGILSTAADFVTYLKFHLNNGRTDSGQLIPENVMGWLRRRSNGLDGLMFKSSESDLLYGDIGYGLGVFIGTYNGYLKISHGGYLPPYLSMMTFVPELNIGILTTINGPGSLLDTAVDHDVVHARIYGILTNSSNKVEKLSSMASAAEIPKIGSLVSKVQQKSKQNKFGLTQAVIKNEDLVGLYGNPLSGDLIVTLVNDTTMYLNYGRYGQAYLVQRGLTAIYDIVWDSDITQVFLCSDPTVPELVLDFSEPLVAYLDDLTGLPTMAFFKDLTIDLLPSQPWDPNSC